jgi:hypothetical protein
MSITKTKTLLSVNFTKATEVPMVEPDTLWVNYITTFSETGHEPVRRTDVYRLYADSDISGEESLVQAFWNVAFGQQ